ncbi:MAG: pantoate--beta-alanine ligase [Thermoanaerobaculia bacterium]
MEIVRTVEELRAAVSSWRRRGERIGFVPTMGALHAGHLSLVALARRHAERVVASVFVNPTQFGPGEDFARYPRTPESDARELAAAGCDLLFLPEVETIYPPGNSTRVRVEGASRGFEGDFRPGHFEGVATVVTQLLLLVMPDVAVFGEKDAQQLAVVRRLAADLHLPVELVPGPIVREADGLAMSSRNRYLSPEERRAATAIPRALAAAGAAIAAGERDPAAVAALVRSRLAGEPRLELQYVGVVDPETFAPRARVEGEVVIPVAVRVGSTRLLDNLRLTVD